MKIQEYYQMEKVKKSQYHLILAAGRTWSQLLDYGTAREDIVRLVSVLVIRLWNHQRRYSQVSFSLSHPITASWALHWSYLLLAVSAHNITLQVLQRTALGPASPKAGPE